MLVVVEDLRYKKEMNQTLARFNSHFELSRIYEKRTECVNVYFNDTINE